MQRLTTEQVTAVIDCPPGLVYRTVSGVTRTPEWSPEVVDCAWVPPATGPTPGARFVATNRRGWLTWRNTPKVTVAEDDRCFAIQRTERGAGTLTWMYLLEPVDGRTRVTLGYEVIEPVPLGLHVALRVLFGVRDLKADLRENMRASLRRLADVISRSDPARAR